jgi:hypothetical protein
MTIQSWWLKGRSDAVRSIMGSSGGWDRSTGGQQDIMSGSVQPEVSADQMPYLMGSLGSWDASLGGQPDIMNGSAQAGLSAEKTPYLMSSPGQWNPSLDGPQDIMGAGRRTRSTSSWSPLQTEAISELPNLTDRKVA